MSARAHNTDANTGLCVAGSATSLASHAAGLAIDIQPRSITLESARRLWTEANAAACRFQATCGDYSGAPSHAELRGNVQSILVTTEAGTRNSLATGKPLTPAQLHNFAIHLELVERARTVRWLTVIAPGTTAVSADGFKRKHHRELPNQRIRRPGARPEHRRSVAQWLLMAVRGQGQVSCYAGGCRYVEPGGIL